MRCALPLLALLVSLAAACSGNDDARPTSTQARAAPSEVPPTQTFTQPTPEPGPPEPPFTVQLLDIDAGTVVTLFEHPQQNPYLLRFEPDDETITIRYPEDGKGIELRLRYDGTEISSGPPKDPCMTVDGGVEVGGRVYGGVACGLISPDARWMTYALPVKDPPDARQRGDWDQWVVDIKSGETHLLQAGLRHCGGCDSRFGPAWSPDSRFVYFPELVQHGTTFISDMKAGTTRELFTGSTELGEMPSWSPSEDHIVAYLLDGNAVLHDPVEGRVREIPALQSSLAFDATGRYLYSPALGDPAFDGTTVYDVHEATVVATIPGQASFQAFFGLNRPLVATPTGFLAAFQRNADCDSTAIYQNGSLGACLPGLGPEISPDGSRVAFTAGDEIHVFYVATGRTSVVASGIETDGPARIVWNDPATHVLIQWPAFTLGP